MRIGRKAIAMKIENSKIIEATRRELYVKYLDEGWDYVTTFPGYLYAMEAAGVKIVKDGANEEKRNPMP